MSGVLKRSIVEGIQAVCLPSPGGEEWFVSADAPHGGDAGTLQQSARGFLGAHGLKAVAGLAFGACDAGRPADGLPWPVTWAGADGGVVSPATGIQVHAVTGLTMEPVVLDGLVVGHVVDAPDARWCVLSGVGPADGSADRATQARSVFERLEATLASAGLGLPDLARTWLYLDRILEWYDDFNRVRTEFFTQRGVFDGLVPASTGIGAGNPQGYAMVAGALAIRPRNGSVAVVEVASPLQCTARAYRSSFSRAVEIRRPGIRRLLVSGTASIAPDGATAWPTDVRKQVDLTLDVVEGILQSRQMGWADITRSVAYFPDLANAHHLDAALRERGIAAMPLTLAKGDVCRDDLLFELEADAAVVAGL
jgi:enamine deaminase RidA (YjgF/YER057c/UK114 family)